MYVLLRNKSANHITLLAILSKCQSDNVSMAFFCESVKGSALVEKLKNKKISEINSAYAEIMENLFILVRAPSIIDLYR